MFVCNITDLSEYVMNWIYKNLDTVFNSPHSDFIFNIPIPLSKF